MDYPSSYINIYLGTGYETAIKEGPTIVYICCGGLFFLKNVSLVDRDMMINKWECNATVVNAAFWAIENNVYAEYPNLTLGNVISGKNYFCANCKVSIKKEKIPTIALLNGLQFPKKVERIQKLTRLEERLVSPCHVFQFFLAS